MRRYIRAKQRLLALLHEQKQAIIHQAVTRGLDASAPLKPSGVAWLGEVPAHWERTRLKFVGEIQTGLTLGKVYLNDELEKRPYLRVANVQSGYLNLATIATVRVPFKEAKSYELRPGDVLMTEGGDIDKLGRGYVWQGEIPGCLHQNHIFAVRVSRKRIDVVLWDDDRNLSTTDDQVRANGSIELSPDVDFRWLKESGRAANFEFTVELEQEVELELESRISRELEPLRYQIARLNLGDYVAFVGVVPVYIQVVMPIYLRADGEVSAGMVMAVTQTLTVEAGVRRYNGEWQPIGDLDNRFTFEPPRLSLGGKVKGYIDPPLSLLLYGVGGPFAGANPFLELEADLFKTPWWELHAGIDVTVGVRGEILGRSLGEYTHAVIGYRVLLAQATTRPPTTPHSPSPADAVTATSLAPTLSWQGTAVVSTVVEAVDPLKWAAGW